MDEINNKKSNRVYLALKPANCFVLKEAQIAIINWLFSRKIKGSLIANLHDLTTANYSVDKEKVLLSHLSWLGINWHDEPDDFGKHQSLRQSFRIDIYQEYLFKLIQEFNRGALKGHLILKDQNKAENEGTLRASSSLKTRRPDSPLPITNAIEFDTRSTVILKPYLDQDFEVTDLLHHQIKFGPEDSNEIVLWEECGKPAEIFAQAVDNDSMKITHSIRSLDMLWKTKQEVIIAKSMGWSIPNYGHVPTPHNDICEEEEGHNLHSIEALRRDGYLPYSIICWLGLPELAFECCEQHTLKGDIIQFFNLENISGREYDLESIQKINQIHLKTMDIESLVRCTIPFLRKLNIPVDDKEKISKVINFLRNYLSPLSALAEGAKIFFYDQHPLNDKSVRSILRKESSQKVLWSFMRRAKTVELMSQEVFLGIMQAVQYETGILGRDLWLPIRLALTGTNNQYELALVAEILGKEQCIKRICQIVGNYW